MAVATVPGSMSPGSTERPRSNSDRSIASVNSKLSRNAVATELGHTQLTRKPSPPNSTANDLVSITTPPFDAQYAAL